MKRVVFLFVLIAAMLLSSQTVKADKLTDNGKFTMSLRDENGKAYKDHVRIMILMADLEGRDTWMEDGYIRAYEEEPGNFDKENKGKYINIARVYTYDQDGNGLPQHRIKAQLLMEGATVILNNAGYVKLEHTEKEYSITKQGDYDYP